MQPDLHMYINAAWLTVAVVWLAGAFTTKKISPRKRIRLPESRPASCTLHNAASISVVSAFHGAYAARFSGLAFPSDVPGCRLRGIGSDNCGMYVHDLVAFLSGQQLERKANNQGGSHAYSKRAL